MIILDVLIRVWSVYNIKGMSRSDIFGAVRDLYATYALITEKAVRKYNSA